MNEREKVLAHHAKRLELYDEALEAAYITKAPQGDLPVFSLEGEFPLEKDFVVVPLADLSVKDLKAKAKELGLEGYSNLSKDELIAAIEGG